MLIDWLYRTTLEVSLLIGLILLIRPVVRKTLGARATYWLWFLPLIRVLIPNRLSRPPTVLEGVPLPSGQLAIAILPNPDVLLLLLVAGRTVRDRFPAAVRISSRRFRKSIQRK